MEARVGCIPHAKTVEYGAKLAIGTGFRLGAESGRIIRTQALPHGKHGAVMTPTATTTGRKIGLRGGEQRGSSHRPQQDREYQVRDEL